MPEIRLELSSEVVQKLDTEVDLLGFEDRQAYLRWIIGNRGAIEQGTERDQLLTEYQSRVEELESELEARQTEETARSDHREARGTRARATDGSGATADDGSAGIGSPSAESASGDAPTGAEPTAPESTAAESSASESSAAETTVSKSSSPGSPDAESTVADRPTEDPAAPGDDDMDVQFRPERVERFEDESLGTQADQLRGVEGERLDEFARRAVAKTRERLGREPSTGLDYRSQTRIARSSSDVRPGEDIADLDELDVPGRSPEAQAPRREAVGAALAYLRDVGRAKRSDFVAELYEEYPAGYDSESGWWRCVKRGLKDARVVDGGENSRVWRYEPPGSKEGELVGGGPKRIVDPE